MNKNKTSLTRSIASAALACAVALNCVFAVAAQTKKPLPAKQSAKSTVAEQAWIENTLRKMTLRERIGQMIVVGAIGDFKNVGSEKFADVKRQILENKVGGFVFYRGDVLELAALTNEMQRAAKIPLLMAADFERGLPMQIKSGTSFTHNMGIAATGNPENAYRKGRIIAEEMRALGINWLYGPVADVANNAGNTMVNVRSYGENPQKVAEFIASEVRGLKDGGVLSTVKHFPGHGDTPIDSHIDLPVINISRERLNSVELAPNRAAFAAGVDSIMTAHVALPQITGDEIPASLSPKINQDLIRRELNFDGIVLTDSLGMGAIIKNYPGAEGSLRAIKAGADIALLPPDPKAAIDRIEQVVRTGEIPAAQIDSSVRRILRAKFRLGLSKTPQVDLNRINQTIEKPENVRFANELAEHSITLLRNEGNVLPLEQARAQKTLFIVAAGDDDPEQGKILETEINRRVKNARLKRIDRRTTEREYDQIFDEAKRAEIVVAATFVKRAALKGTIALPEAEAEFVRKLIDLKKPVAIAAFGSPYQIQQFPDAKVYLAAYAVEDVAQTAGARAIFGETAISGRSPVSLPGFFRLGDGLQLASLKSRQKDATEITEIPN